MCNVIDSLRRNCVIQFNNSQVPLNIETYFDACSQPVSVTFLMQWLGVGDDVIRRQTFMPSGIKEIRPLSLRPKWLPLSLKVYFDDLRNSEHYLKACIHMRRYNEEVCFIDENIPPLFCSQKSSGFDQRNVSYAIMGLIFAIMFLVFVVAVVIFARRCHNAHRDQVRGVSDYRRYGSPSLNDVSFYGDVGKPSHDTTQELLDVDTDDITPVKQPVDPLAKYQQYFSRKARSKRARKSHHADSETRTVQTSTTSLETSILCTSPDNSSSNGSHTCSGSGKHVTIVTPEEHQEDAVPDESSEPGTSSAITTFPGISI